MHKNKQQITNWHKTVIVKDISKSIQNLKITTIITLSFYLGKRTGKVPDVIQ